MKHTYPNYYKIFKCVANKCIDSCCKEWDVVVDDNSYEFYNSVKGEFGDKLRSQMKIDEDGDRVFVSQTGRCPFWNKDELCDIYINLGEEHLCHTCTEFPRLRLDYTAFCEHMLSFACPEASRLILSEDTAYSDFDDYDLSANNLEYSAEYMDFLLSTRKQFAKIITDREKSFAERLNRVVLYSQMVQSMIDNEDFCKDISPNSNESDLEISLDRKSIFLAHKNFEIMSGEWQSIIDKASEICDTCEITNNFDTKFERLSLYYLYRYYLSAIDDWYIGSTVKRIVCAYTVIGVALNLGENFENLARLYSKEVEHSYENSEFFDS